MRVPIIDWIPFDASNPPANLNPDGDFLILLREDDYDDGATWHYSIDIGTPYGSYIDNFWDTTNDWDEGQRVEVIAYADPPYYIAEKDLVELAPERDKCPFCGGKLEVVPFVYRIEELPKPIKLFGRWSLIKMRYREIPTGYTVECADFCDGFAASCLYAVGLSEGEAIAEWNRKVKEI